MPYSSVSGVVKRFPKLKKYPAAARAMFLKVVNAALKTYPDDEGKAIASAWSAVNEKYGRRDEFHHDECALHFDLANLIEYDNILEIPTVFTREGVQNGGLKPWDELSDPESYRSLEHRPVVYQHPPDERPVDSCDPIIGEALKIDVRHGDNVVRGITRIHKDKAPQWYVDELKAGRNREGSVGYWSVSDLTSGVFKGKPYERVERQIRYDHYAVGIPKGACSVADGCGLRFDEEEPDLSGGDLVNISKLKSWVLGKLKPENPKKPEEGERTMSEEKGSQISPEIEAQLKELRELRDAKAAWETEKTGLATQLQAFKDAEAARIEAQRQAIIKDLIEGTEEKAEDYEGWSVPQLEKLKMKVVKPPQGGQSPKPTDRRGQTPPTGGSEPPASLEDSGKGLTVGSLFGKPMPGANEE